MTSMPPPAGACDEPACRTTVGDPVVVVAIGDGRRAQRAATKPLGDDIVNGHGRKPHKPRTASDAFENRIALRFDRSMRLPLSHRPGPDARFRWMHGAGAIPPAPFHR